MAILGVLALLVFGEERLPGILRQAGRMMREVQNTSHSFIREMERAADVNEPPPPEPEQPEEPVSSPQPSGARDAEQH